MVSVTVGRLWSPCAAARHGSECLRPCVGQECEDKSVDKHTNTQQFKDFSLFKRPDVKEKYMKIKGCTDLWVGGEMRTCAVQSRTHLTRFKVDQTSTYSIRRVGGCRVSS